VLSVHARACNLLTGSGEVIALVSPEIGDGPLCVVLGDRFCCLDSVPSGARVICGPERLVLDADAGGVAVSLEAADTWEPRPDWDGMRVRRAEINVSVTSLARLCLGHDPGNPLLALLGAPFLGQRRALALVERFHEAALAIEAGWRGDEGALSKGGALLAGLGEGLTPAGDDFVVGMMLWAWLAHPTPEVFCRVLSEAAMPRTTILSAEYLRAAARGQCNAAWHRLLDALAEAEPSRLRDAAQGVLAYGASSGLDALIGFLYLSQKGDGCQ
jgi:hypothetical protein